MKDSLVAKLIEKEESDMREKGDGKIHTFTLADLVMMQMVGEFERFLGVLPSQYRKEDSFEPAERLIEETKKG